ncbi:MAG: EAL domain-containing protein [Leptolyngbyaceae bacterium]|nr:EAL domain-containing protein [Leptolyngbyaceae bacterium]
MGLHLASDALIVLSYYSIPLLLIYFVRQRKDIPFPKVFLLFSAFILACGTSHLMEIWTLWHPSYWVSGIFKAVTAVISTYTALNLIPLIPLALQLPSPGQLRKTNQALEAEIIRRQQTEATLRLFVEHSPAAIAMFDTEMRYILASKRWLTDHGIEAHNIIGRSYYEVLPETPENKTQIYQRCLAGEVMSCKEESFMRSDGTTEWKRWEIRPWFTCDREIGGIIKFTEIISEQKRAKEALFQEKELAEITLKSIGDAVITTDHHGHITYLNPVAEELTGWSNRDAKGQNIPTVLNIIHESTRESVVNPIEQVLQEQRTVELAHHTVLISRQGREYAIEDSAAPIFNLSKQLVGTVMVFRDVTHSRELSNQLSWQAQHDGLTGLYNRWRFEQDLAQAISEASKDQQTHCLCYLDLDQFKIVNDTCGHRAGDELLRQVAHDLQRYVRSSDVLARLGGDEFGILLYGCPIENAKPIAQKLQDSIRDFRFVWGDKTFAIGVSIGIVTINQESLDLAAVLSAADAACYAAKDAGRNRIHIYQANDQVLNRQRDERQWTVKIQHALEHDLFQLHYQKITPTVPTDSHLSDHYEILVRMVNEETGTVIPPMAFIPAAERYGLMPAIDRWVVQSFCRNYEKVCRQITFSRSCERPKFMLNLSGASICSEQFLATLLEIFRSNHELAHQICFEITETAAIANLNQAADFIRKLRKYGCQFALDDFGSGMSSFGYLKSLPVDYLKIDGNFVRDILEDPIDFTIVKFIHTISKTIGMKTIAEFVENQIVRDRLHEIGVDYVQGYGIAMPTPLSMTPVAANAVSCH